MKITTLELENVKRVRALRLEPTAAGLTVIGGKNGQGKTSVLDAIAYALGGKKYKPTNLKRDGAVGAARIRIETDNGYIIERIDEKAVKVIDKSGAKGGQAILDQMVSDLAIDLPKFHNANAKDKATKLLAVLGLEEVIAKFDRDIKAKFDTRTLVGREADQKDKAAKDMPFYEDAPESQVSVKELIQRQQEVLSRNGIKEEHRRNLESMKRQLADVNAQIESYERSLASFKSTQKKLELSVKEADGEDFTLESTEELERQIADFETINDHVKANEERSRRQGEADLLHDQYDTLTTEIEALRAERLKTLEGAKLPLEGLTVEDGELLFNGKAWDCMSGSQQLIVDCAIAARINPECRFVLMDKLEQLDLDTLQEFGKWLEENDLQCIATRVSTGGECSIIIEDGEAVTPEGTVVVPVKKTAAPLSDDDY